jgi:hypothetical protein
MKYFYVRLTCIMNYLHNNQLDVLFILRVLNYHTCPYFGRINSPSSGGRMSADLGPLTVSLEV